MEISAEKIFFFFRPAVMFETDKQRFWNNAVHEDGVEVAAISAIMRGESENQRTMENCMKFPASRVWLAGSTRLDGYRNFNTSAVTAGILYKRLRRFLSNHYYTCAPTGC